jgi:DNA-binding beta-propeller fold protein YncE
MKRLAVALGVVVAVVAVVFLVVSRSSAPPIAGLAPQGADPFAHDAVEPGPYRGWFSPDGSKLAVLAADGLGLSERGKVRALTPKGSRVVDAAWFHGGTALLVAEGPVPTGTLAVIDTEGNDKGTVTLTPSVAFGNGFGIAVSPDNKQAIVTAVDRPTLSQTEQRWLVRVDLATGETSALTPMDDTEELGPVYLDAHTVMYTARAVGRPPVVRAIDLDTKQVRSISPPGTSGRAIGTIGADGQLLVIVTGRSIEAVSRSGGSGQRLGTVPGAAEVIAVQPAGTLALIATSVVDAGQGSQATQLRAMRLKPPKPR